MDLSTYLKDDGSLVDLDEFNLNEFNSTPSNYRSIAMSIYGPRMSGKTTMLKALGDLFCRKENTVVYMLSYLDQLDDDSNIISLRHLDDIKNLWLSISKDKQRDPSKHTVVLIDDAELYLQGGNGRLNNIIKRYVMNGRFYNLSLIVACQDTRIFTPDVRCNIDYVMILRHHDTSLIRSLHDNCNNVTFSTFSRLVKKYCILDIHEGVRGLIIKTRTGGLRHFNTNSERYMAVDRISDWWKRILNQRIARRQRIGQELQHLPGVGIKFHNAMENIQTRLKNQKN
jgi:hypothetical protein